MTLASVALIAGAETDVPAYLRSHGRLSLKFEQRAGASVLQQRQEGGCLRVRVPRTLRGAIPEAVIINTSGGLCGGDTIAQAVAWGEGTTAVVTTQAAEKVYTSRGQPCTVSTRLSVARGARGEWLPQETIVFDGARLDRATDIDLDEAATFLWCETMVYGRVARGETMTQGALRDRVRIRRGGRLIYADVMTPGDAPDALLRRAAIGNQARASAVVLAIGGGGGGGGDGASRRDALRDELECHGDVLAGTSAWNGILAVRMVARDPAALRRCVAGALHILRGSADLPRVWRC